MPLAPGEIVLDRYRIDDLLPQGGMGAVYRAWDLRLSVFCALKEMVPHPAMDEKAVIQMREQFLQEAQVLAKLQHPHMPRVTDHFEWEGNAYLVMGFAEGQRLDEIIEENGTIPAEIMLDWARELFSALSYCHEQGIVHRDVKPQNVIITPEGNVMLVDFGLAKLIDLEDQRTRTVMRGLGTPEYAPPEQYDAVPGSTDERSDIYGLGATLYHALAGTPPPTATQRIVDPGLLRPLHEFVSDVDPRLDDAIIRSLSLQPDQRFQTVSEMAEAVFGQPVVKPSSRPMGAKVKPTSDPLGTVAMPAGRRTRIQRWWAGAGGGVVLLVILFFVLRGCLAAGATASSTPTPSPTTVEVVNVSTPSPTPSLTPTPSACSLVNPHFDQGFDGWVAPNGNQVAPEDPNDGFPTSPSRHVIVPGRGLGIYQTVALSVDSDLSAWIWVKSDADRLDNQNSVRIIIDDDLLAPYLAENTWDATEDGDWHQYLLEYAVPSDGNYIIYFETNAAEPLSGDAQVDLHFDYADVSCDGIPTPPTLTPTPTPTNTPTGTPTGTPTRTGTATRTATATATSTATPTPTNTRIPPTRTPTGTPTNTPMPSATLRPPATPTNTRRPPTVTPPPPTPIPPTATIPIPTPTDTRRPTPQPASPTPAPAAAATDTPVPTTEG